MPATVSRDAQVLKFFAQQCRGIPRKRHVKLVYLADVLAREYLGHPISSFEYVRLYYGPYDRRFPEVAQELVLAGLAEEVTEHRTAYPAPQRTIRLVDLGLSVPFEFSLGELEVLRYVTENYLDMPMEELIEDVIYETEPMKAGVSEESRLPMELADRRGVDAVGFDLEAVLAAEREIAEGKFTTSF
jgi:hypothetical protein